MSLRKVFLFCLLRMGVGLPHGVSLQFYPVGGVQQPVADGIGQGRVSDVGMPVTDGALAGDDCCTGLVTVFHDLEQVLAFPLGGRGEEEVVDDQQLCSGQPFKKVHEVPVVCR
jgi:hypothetical protein